MVAGQSGQLPTRVSAEQKVQPGSSGAQHYHLPTQFKMIIYAPVICREVVFGWTCGELDLLVVLIEI